MSIRNRLVQRLAEVELCSLSPSELDQLIDEQALALGATPDYIRLLVESALKGQRADDDTARIQRGPKPNES